MIPDYVDKSKLPKKSGVYLFLDKVGQVLYVGKAIDLYHRVSSYFNPNVEGKTAALVSRIAKVDTIIVESELEALILEANLIKKYLPIFNLRLVDDKDYLYIGLTKEDFPRVITVRKQDLKKVKKYWGPFPSSKTVRDTLKQLRKVFPWCSNPPKILQYRDWKFKACFYYHLGQCPGLCVGLISKGEYNKIMSRFSKFLDGKKEELVTELSSEMMDDAKNQQFEKASQVKKMIYGINYLTQINRVQVYLENPNFLQEETKTSLLELQKDLNLEMLPERVEGYDISQLFGQEAVGSLVVLTDGGIDKSQYRKFKIHLTGKPNDVGMHREMIRRRLTHPEWPYPDLVIIDGGRAQARAAASIFLEYNLNIPVFGLAKRMEWLYPSNGEVIKLPKRSLSLRLLQKLRDESHRFALSYHRKLHQKAFLNT